MPTSRKYRSNGRVVYVSKSEKTEELKPTHARQIEDMNELQLEREIRKLERWTEGSRKEVERRSNTQSMRFFDDVHERFPGGVGGSAITPKYQRMQEKWFDDMGKLNEAQEKYKSRSERLQRMKDAYDKVKGTGKTLRTVATATASKGNGTWTKTTISIYGDAVKGERMGDYVVAKPFFTYNLYDSRTGKQIKTFKSKKAAKEYAEKA
ncbi:MAG: hypothetical protein J6A30_09595 [Ruminococcus sp.]|nr:hypothetical protein [Ruminococcus sp.]